MTTTRNAILAAVPLRNRSIMIKADQDVQDIIRCLTHYHKKHVPQYDRLAHEFYVGSDRDIAYALWEFCRRHVRYVVEDEEKQTVRSPARILSEGEGDCKHYASFIAGVLDGLKRQGVPLDWAYRFADYTSSRGEVTHHVFVVLRQPGGKEIWIDPVLNWFDYHLPYTKAITRTIDTLTHEQKMGCPGQDCSCGYDAMGATGDQYLPVPAGYPSNIPRPVLTTDHKLLLRDNMRVLTTAEKAWVQKALQPLIIQYAPKPYNIYWSIHGWGSGMADIDIATNPFLRQVILGNTEKDFLQYPPQPGGFDSFLIGLNDVVPALIGVGANLVLPGSGGIASSIVASETGGGGGNTNVNLSSQQLQNYQQQQQPSTVLPGLSSSKLLPWLIIGTGVYFLMKKN